MSLQEDIREILTEELAVSGEGLLQYAGDYPRSWGETAKNTFKTALRFARYAHKGVTRKGLETMPYVLHPLEAALVVLTLTEELEVVVAALLHDVVEDTDFTSEDVELLFGAYVAELVAHESEDKHPDRPAAETWRLRKETALQELVQAPLEAKMVCLGDKLSNIRQTVITYADKGDAMWVDFNQKDPAQQAWYYKGIGKALSQLEHTAAYQEYLECCKRVFGRLGDK